MKHALRFWARHGTHALWLTTTLGLGLGVVGAAWTIAGALWLRPLPYPGADRLVQAGWTLSEPTFEGLAPPDAGVYVDWRDGQSVFSSMAGFRGVGFADLVTPGGVHEVRVAQTTENFFGVLNLAPIAGRLLQTGDADRPRPAAIIAEPVWRELFGGDLSFPLNDFRLTWFGRELPVTVVGVMPSGMRLPGWNGEPLDVVVAMPETLGQRHVIARLADGVTAADASAQLTDLLRATDAREPAGLGERRVEVITLHAAVFGDTRQLAWLFVAAAGLVLVVAVANSAALTLALSARRRRELAVRRALGADTGRLMRLLGAEAVVVATAALGLGVLASPALYRAFLALAPGSLPRLAEIGVDLQPLTVMGVLAVTVAVALGLAPAIGRRRGRLAPELMAAAGTTSAPNALRARHALVAAQVALVLGILTSSAILLTTLERLGQQPLGFEPDGVTEVSVLVPRDVQGETNSNRFAGLLTEIESAARAVPGRRTVAIGNEAPLNADIDVGDSTWRILFPGRRETTALVRMVSEQYFEVLGVPVLRGRRLDRADLAGPPVAVVSRGFSDAHLGGIDRALDQTVPLGEIGYRVVGVVDDVRNGSLREEAPPTLYVPLGSRDWRWGRLVVLTREDGPSNPAALGRAVQSVLPDMRVSVSLLADRYRSQTAGTRTQAAAISFLGAFTLLLAALGLYALVSQVVTERTRELGIRAALGAAPGRLVRLVARSIGGAIAAGMISGLLVAALSVRLVRAFLFDTSPFDPIAWTASVVALLVVAAGAVAFPARRAARLDPARVLRE